MIEANFLPLREEETDFSYLERSLEKFWQFFAGGRQMWKRTTWTWKKQFQKQQQRSICQVWSGANSRSFNHVLTNQLQLLKRYLLFWIPYFKLLETSYFYKNFVFVHEFGNIDVTVWLFTTIDKCQIV